MFDVFVNVVVVDVKIVILLRLSRNIYVSF